MKPSGQPTHLWEQRSFFPHFLQTICYEPLHGFGAVLVQLAEVWGSIAPANHENDLHNNNQQHKGQLHRGLSTAGQL